MLAARDDDNDDEYLYWAVLILVYGFSKWTLKKCTEKKLDSNYTRMLRVLLNKSWRQHSCYTATYHLSGNVFKVLFMILKNNIRIISFSISLPNLFLILSLFVKLYVSL